MVYPNLRALIIQRGMKHSQLAKVIGISPGMLSLSLNGKREFTMSEIKKIVEFFNLPFEYIFLEFKFPKQELD